MADVKISGLPASTTPLAGTEVLPIVQSGATKQVSIANVTAGRAIAATSITTDTYKAASSSGGTLQNSSGAAQLQWGSGGGNNLSVDVAININPVNAAVSISPTGTGTVAISPAGALTINPTAASTMNNVVIGGSTAAAITGTTVTASTGNVTSTAGYVTAGNGRFFGGGTSVTITADNTWTNLGVGANSGLYVFRDGSAGNTAVFRADPNGGAVALSNGIGGGFNMRYDVGAGDMQVQVTSTAPKSLNWVALISNLS